MSLVGVLLFCLLVIRKCITVLGQYSTAVVSDDHHPTSAPSQLLARCTPPSQTVKYATPPDQPVQYLPPGNFTISFCLFNF